MHFKLILAFVGKDATQTVLAAARAAGATGYTLINQARSEGRQRVKTFFGLDLDSLRDVILMVVEEHLSRRILEAIAQAGGFNERPDAGIALQLDVGDVVGIEHQIHQLSRLFGGAIAQGRADL